MFQALHPEVELGNRVVDVFPSHIIHHLAPKMSDDWYSDYVKQLDGVLLAVKSDVSCIFTVSDVSAPTKGNLQASLASLVFRGSTKVAHIMVVGGWVMAPNVELMALEMSNATALVAGCLTLVCFMDSTSAMSELVDPSPHSRPGCSAL